MSNNQLPARSPIGIDIGRHSIKAVQLRGGRGGWQLQTAVVLPRQLCPTTEAAAGNPLLDLVEARRLSGVLRRGGFYGQKCVVAVPDRDLMSGMLDLPPRAPGVPVDAIARMEFARVHKCDASGIELSCWDLPEAARASKGTAMMAVGYAHAAADTYLDVLEEGGLDVVGVDTAASALARACTPLLESDGTTAVLDIGMGDARLVLVQGGVVTYERNLTDGGLATLAATLRQRLDLDDEQVQYVLTDAGLGEPGERRGAESLATARQAILGHLAPLLQDLQMTFSYAEQRYPTAPVHQLLLSGGGAVIPNVAMHMATALNMVVRCVGCADVVKCAGSPADQTTPLFLKAIGLAQFSDIQG